jgi:YHS domain-containing protein
MNLLRLLALGLLGYGAWRVLRGQASKKQPVVTTDNNATPQDALVEDPICHVLIPKHQAVRLRQDGKTYYFCSERCCDQFAGTSKQQGEV